MPRMTVRPSKGQSAGGLIASLIFLLLLLVVFVPVFFQAMAVTSGMPGGGAPIGLFVAFMVLLTLAGVGYYAYNLLAERPISRYEVDVDERAREPGGAGERPDGAEPVPGSNDFEARLRKLERLRADGLISEAEFAAKRAEIMAQAW